MRAEQKRSVWPVLIAVLQIISWVPASTRPAKPSAPYFHAFHPNAAQLPQHLKSKQEMYGNKMKESVVHEEGYKGLSTLGSRPPNCVHKCGECYPCQAIQVPTTTYHMATQDANYEPEGWKCKCGSSFFNP